MFEEKAMQVNTIEHRMPYYKDYYCRAVLKKILENGGRLRPGYNPKTGGLTYGGLDPNELERAMPKLLKGQLVRIAQVTSVATCPFHGETAFHVFLRCKAHKAPLERKELWEHVTCGYISSSDAFKGEEGLACPRCRVKVKGTDLRRLGAWFTCKRGGENVPDPEIVLYCLSGNHEILLAEADFTEKVEYELMPNLLDEVNSIISFYDSIKERVESKGYSLVEPLVKGASGAEHQFDLVARDRDGKIFVVEAFFSEHVVSEVPILGFLTKIYDIRPGTAIFVAVPSISPAAKEIFSGLGVTLLTAPTIHEAKAKFSEIIL